MDRGIPTEEVLGEMRAADPPVRHATSAPASSGFILVRLGRAEGTCCTGTV